MTGFPGPVPGFEIAPDPGKIEYSVLCEFAGTDTAPRTGFRHGFG